MHVTVLLMRIRATPNYLKLVTGRRNSEVDAKLDRLFSPELDKGDRGVVLFGEVGS